MPLPPNPTPAQQIAQALYDAGVRGQDLMALVAISLAENGAQLSSASMPAGSIGGFGTAGEVGPLQIHPVHFGTGAGEITPQAANSYEGSARYATYLTYGTSQGLGHWSAFNEGTWQAHAKEAVSAIQSTVGPTALQGSSQIPGVQPGSSALARTAGLTNMPQNIASGAVSTFKEWSDIIPTLQNTVLSGQWWRKAWTTTAAVGLIAGGIVIWVTAKPSVRSDIQKAGILA